MPGRSSPLIDTASHRQRRERAAAGFGGHNFLKQAVADRIADRVGLMQREFPLVLDLGCHRGEVAQALATTNKVGRVICADPSFGMARRADSPALVMDYDRLCFAANSFDAIVSGFALHWVNDMAGLLGVARRLLKEDGLLLISMPGGTSFAGLRATLAMAETEISGGLSPRVLPMADMRACAGLLTQAGFALPVADSETMTITWADAWAMMRDLRGMGETNALVGRIRHFTGKTMFDRSRAIYGEKFATSDGRVYAEIELITLTAWTPSSSQQTPLPPGSGRVGLAEALNTN